MIIEYVIPLLSLVVGSELFTFIFVPLICLAFLSTVPFIIRHFLGRD